MFFNNDIVADRLPPGTLCLTYDDGPGKMETSRDGPGPCTVELGAFLHSEGAPATFFAVGKFAESSGAILAGLQTLGHLVANHTFDHPSLPAFVARGGDVIDQLARTHSAIGTYALARPGVGARSRPSKLFSWFAPAARLRVGTSCDACSLRLRRRLS
jgi:hypothetical protein